MAILLLSLRRVIDLEIYKVQTHITLRASIMMYILHTNFSECDMFGDGSALIQLRKYSQISPLYLGEEH